MQGGQGDLEQNISDEGENSPKMQSGNIGSISEHLSETSKPVDVSSRVWKLFLDSKCSSAIVFFRLHLSARTYFRNPTPWNPGNVSNLSRKVSQLLDSFRPGSSSYSPFQKKTDENNNESIQRSETLDGENNNVEYQLSRPSAIIRRVVEESNGNSTTQTNNVNEIADETHQSTPETDQATTLSREEENRRRLYLNLGRPRPFYRVPSRNDQNNPETAIPVKSKKTNRLLTLQECSRNEILTVYGLKNIRNLTEDTGSSIRLPEKIRNFLFTFACHDFEEVGCDRPCKSASYNVRSLIDGEKYTAVFATSDADKAVSNLWSDEADWLMLRDPGVTQILAIAVDPLTENIFYIIPERGTALTNLFNNSNDTIDVKNETFRTKVEMAEFIKTRVTSTLETLLKSGKPYGPLKEEHIFINQGEVLIENKLLVKPVRITSDQDIWQEHKQNMHNLDCILVHVMK